MELAEKARKCNFHINGVYLNSLSLLKRFILSDLKSGATGKKTIVIFVHNKLAKLNFNN